MSTFRGIALKLMPQYTSDGKSTLVQIMAWCCQATSLNQCQPRSVSQYTFTGPQAATVWSQNWQHNTNFAAPYSLKSQTWLWSSWLLWLIYFSGENANCGTCVDDFKLFRYEYICESDTLIPNGTRSSSTTLSQTCSYYKAKSVG